MSLKETKIFRNNKPRTTIPQKIGLAFFGVILCFLLLEVGMRVSGWVITEIQERDNRKAIAQKGTYRILCLGESTTAAMAGKHDYPFQLQKILDQNNLRIKFAVINKGVIGSQAEDILDGLESNLEKYSPDLVIAMMGINEGNALVNYNQEKFSLFSAVLRESKVYKLFRFLNAHLRERSAVFPEGKTSVNTEKNTAEISKKNFKKKKILNTNESNWTFEAMENEIEKTYGEGEYQLLPEKFWKSFIDQNPVNQKIYFRLARYYEDLESLETAEKIWKKAIELNPNEAWPYARLAEFYFYNRGSADLTEKIHKEALEILKGKEKKAYIYGSMAFFYQMNNQSDKAENAWKMAISQFPEDSSPYLRLGYFYLKQGKVKLAEEIFREGLKMIPNHNNLLRALARVLSQQGDKNTLKEYYELLKEIEEKKYLPNLRQNYNWLYEVLSQRGIKLAAMQYPMRNIRPLKKMLSWRSDIIFIDNEEIFKKAVEQNGYQKYFVDNFGGDFGHCTPDGNYLLAMNVALIIKEKIFTR